MVVGKDAMSGKNLCWCGLVVDEMEMGGVVAMGGGVSGGGSGCVLVPTGSS